jgi:hypothetical protein
MGGFKSSMYMVLHHAADEVYMSFGMLTGSPVVLRHTSPSNELTDRNTEFPILSFREIAAATNNFSESSILGQGGFGNVYKARMLSTYKWVTNGICNPSDFVGLHFAGNVGRWFGNCCEEALSKGYWSSKMK